MGDPRKEEIETGEYEEVEEPLRKVRLQPIVRTSPKIGRNQACPCGMKSATNKPIKYKYCCGNR